jgi:hypothetical protein
MKRAAIAVLSLVLLSSCLDAKLKSDPYASQRQMPPNSTAQCVTFVLVDDKCLREWYACKSTAGGPQSCTSAWRDCCSLNESTRAKAGEPDPIGN